MGRPHTRVRGPSEAQETASLVRWLRQRGVAHFGVPNGAMVGGRNRWGAIGKLKAEGMLPGTPDIVMIDLAPATGQPVALEMKAMHGRVSKQQREVHEVMRRAGWHVIVARGFLEAVTELQLMGY